jgi:hypothetical protein
MNKKSSVRPRASYCSGETVLLARGLGTEVASLFATVGFEADIPELRGHSINPNLPSVAEARVVRES